MDYKKGEFLLIKDEAYKAKCFIGQIIKKVNNDYLMYVYIFPEDTKDGKQTYMSSFEVFLIPDEKMYFLDGTKEEKVKVVSLDEYINRKYINLDEKCDTLYFKRQIYNMEKNLFFPGELELPRICLCQQIFNPDIPFVLSSSGEIFHNECRLQSGKNIPLIKGETESRKHIDHIYNIDDDVSLLNNKRKMEEGSPKKLSEKKNLSLNKKLKKWNKKIALK